MKLLDEYNNKHILINKRLQCLSESKIQKRKMVIVCEDIALELKLSGQTVYNYINGKIKDGYLAESIYKALKKYKAK